MPPEHHFSISCDGSNQPVRIPREFERDGTEAIIRKDGNRLIVESLPRPNRLLAQLNSWEPMDEDFPELEDAPPEHEDIFG